MELKIQIFLTLFAHTIALFKAKNVIFDKETENEEKFILILFITATLFSFVVVVWSL